MNEWSIKKTPTRKVIDKKIYRLNLRSIRYGAIIKLIIVLLLVWGLFTIIFGLAIPRDNSMNPSIKEGDLVLYYRLNNEYESGDVIIFTKDDEQYIGRIAAVPGEQVEITEDGQLIINGYAQIEENGVLTYPVENGCTYPVNLSETQYFILVDARDTGNDSRYFGAINMDEIDGKVITFLRRRNI